MATHAPDDRGGGRLLVDGKPVVLGDELGRGGEATVYALAGAHALERAVKLYHRPDPERDAKLSLMLARTPADPTRAAGHVSIAWPEAIVSGHDGRAIGFVMPRLSGRALPLHQLYHPGSRRRRAPGIDWRYQVRIARNLCQVVASLHEAGYVIGDLNESNILVDERALVTLVDLDSIQVRGEHQTFRCPVGKSEYTPPELQGRAFREIDRRAPHDRYGLAVLIFLLLMEGVHPFAGVHGGEGDPPALEEAMAARRSPYLGRRSGSGALLPSPTAPPSTLLTPELRRLAARALLGGAAWRPAARRWQQRLERLERSLVSCAEVPSHVFGDHLEHCPWCERRDRLGFDAYPWSALSSQPRTAALARPKPRLRASPLGFVRRFPLLALVPLLPALALWGWPRWSASLANVAALLLPAVLIVIGLYGKARISSGFYAGLVIAERLGRALLGATAMALLASSAIALLTGYGSVFRGDWLLVPSLWTIAFVVLWRRLGVHG